MDKPLPLPGIWGSGEGDAKGWQKAMKELKVEVNQEPSKELRRRFPQLFGFISHDAKVDLQEEFDHLVASRSSK